MIEEFCAIFGGRPGAERLADRDDIVVDGLRQADNGEVIAIGAEIGGKIGCGRVGIVAADRVQDGDAVRREPLGRHPQRVFAFFDEAALDAICSIRQLDAAVADRRSAVAMQHVGLLAHLRGDRNTVGQQEALIAGSIGDQLDFRRNVRIAFDQPANRGRKAGREPACGQHCDFLFGHGSSSGVIARIERGLSSASPMEVK